MRTDDLIERLAAEPTPRGPRLGTGFAAGLGLGGIAALAAVAGVLGVRPDLAAGLSHPLALAKLVLPVLLAVAAVATAIRLALPGAGLGWGARALLLPPVLAMGAIAVELVRLPSAEWRAALVGHTLADCLVLIPLLSLPLLAGALVALRRGAPLSPSRAGAAGGLAAGAIATALYALHCPEDSPLFWGIWYSFGLLVPAGIGFSLGGRILRW